MEQTIDSKSTNDPASTPPTDYNRELLGRPFANGLQFEEAVEELREAYEKHPKPPTGVFY